MNRQLQRKRQHRSASHPANDPAIAGGAKLEQLEPRVLLSSSALSINDPEAFANLGSTVSIDGNFAVVGAPGDDGGGILDSGAAYVFQQVGSNWSQVAKLTANDAGPADLFGAAVSVNGNLLIVGAPGDDANRGSAYVFERDGSNWDQIAKIISLDDDTGDQFGSAVDIDGTRIIVGAFGDDAEGVNAGAAYIFENVGASFTQISKLLPSNLVAGDRFGWSVAVEGDTALVGAFADDVSGITDAGSVYVYNFSGASWNQSQQLFASDRTTSDQFGWSIDLEGNLAVIGAVLDDDAGPGAGSAYVFERSGTWTQRQKLLASDAETNDRFGWSVDLDGDKIVVGAPLANVNNTTDAGAVYRFVRSGNWSEVQVLSNVNTNTDSQFGRAVGYDNGDIFIGAPMNNASGFEDAGRVYLGVEGVTSLVAPSQLGPSGTVNDATPTLTWSPVPGAQGYEVAISNQTTGQTVVSNASASGTSYTTSALTNGNNYRWWVQAIGAGGVEGPWSSGLNFTVSASQQQLTAPTLIGPSGTVNDATPTLNWQAVSGAASYDISIRNESTGAVVVNNANTSSTSFTSPALNNGDTYRWWVQGVNAGGTEGPWSSGLNFTVQSSSSSLTAPTAIGPAGNTDDTTPTFSWTSVSGATGYEFSLRNETTGATVASNTAVSGTSFTPSTELTDGHTYRWWVQAIGAGGVEGPWSSGTNVTIDQPDLVAPTLIGPSGQTADTTPTFTWFAVPGADHYEISIQDRTTGGSFENQIIENNTSVSGTSFTSATALTDGHTYRWWVQAVSADGTEGPWSSGANVTINSANLAAPVVLGPTGTSNDTTPTFSWQPVDGATGYEISLRNETTGATVASNAPVAGTSFTPAAALTNGHTYRWWVQATGAGGIEGPWSSGNNVTIEGSVLAAPTGLSPSGNTSDNTPTLSWSPVSGAAGYEISIRNETTGQTVLSNAPVAGTSFTSAALTTGNTYRWWVQAIDGDGVNGQWSAGSNFTVQSSLAAPALIGPSGDTDDLTPTFQWQPVNNAIGYELSLRNETTGATVASNAAVSGTSFTPSTALTDGHTYRWWVQAIGAGGVEGPWSSGMNFTVEEVIVI